MLKEKTEEKEVVKEKTKEKKKIVSEDNGKVIDMKDVLGSQIVSEDRTGYYHKKDDNGYVKVFKRAIAGEVRFWVKGEYAKRVVDAKIKIPEFPTPIVVSLDIFKSLFLK